MMKRTFVMLLAILLAPPVSGKLVFERLSDAPALTPGFGGWFDAHGILDPEILWTGEEIRLYYTAVGDDDVQRIALAVSRDLVLWESRGIVLAPGFAGSFSSGGVFSPSVVYSPGHYILFFTGESGGWRSIGRAESSDGLFFFPSPAMRQPVLSASFQPSRFDYLGASEPDAIRILGMEFLFYHGMDTDKIQRIGLAVSLGGDFVRIPGDEGKSAVFSRGPHGFDDAGALAPEVVLSENNLQLFYTSLHY